MSAPAWLDVLDATITACSTGGRGDLAHELGRQRGRLSDPRLRVVVAGERNQGKSQLINALLDATVCAVGDTVTTPLSVEVGHADVASASLLPASGHGDSASRLPVPIDALSTLTDGSNRHDPRLPVERARAVQVGLPHRLLSSGFVLVDTPAVESPAAALAALGEGDALLLVSDAGHDLTGAGLDLLARASRAGLPAAVAFTKTDLVPRWREAAGRCERQLGSSGVNVPLLPLAAPLRMRAARSGDKASNTESGYPVLIDWLHRELRAKPAAAPATASRAATSAIVALAAPLRDALARPGAAPDSTNAVNGEAQRRIDELRRAASRCQTMLSDEMADLMADVEHDLRHRTRTILHEVERVFERADPISGWEQFAEWLRGSVSGAAEASFGWLLERSEWVADRVAEEFPLPGDEPDALALSLPSDEVAPADDPERPHLEKFSIGQMAFTGMRGSYGGVLMFGLMTSLAGLPLVNPVSLGAGAAFAGKSIHDEGESRLRRRQLAARGAAQRYIDDFFIQFNKHCKDVGKDVHRSLRDQLTELTERSQQRILAAAEDARQAATTSAAEQDRRTASARDRLRQLVALHGRAQALGGGAARAVAGAAR